MLTDNASIRSVAPSLELARISIYALKGMIEGNFWNNRSKVYQTKEINHVVR